jgi:ribonuclease P protein component
MERLRHRADFLAASSGLRASTTGFVLQARSRDDEQPARLGFTVSRKVGNAVVRNRVRRRLKEAVKRAAMDVKPGHDYVLVARTAALTRGFDQLAEDFAGALRRLKPGQGRPSRVAGGHLTGRGRKDRRAITPQPKTGGNESTQ